MPFDAMRWWWLSALVLHVCRSEDPEVQYRYGTMIDAGSEGSRIYIFRWIPRDKRGIVFPEALSSKANARGVASFALEPDLAGASLDPLIEYAEHSLQHVRDQWGASPIYLRATAGMRLLTADEREAVLASIRERLRRTNFLFEEDFAVVATGEEEGIYGWLAVNYLKGNLRSDRRITAASSIGSLDLGGASVQIVFIPELSVMSKAFPIMLGPHHLRVYSTSFLHFGQKEASHRTSSIIISDALLKVQSVAELVHPCYAVGYTYHPRFGYTGNRSFPIDVKMGGSADFESCESLIKRIFHKEQDCLVPSCSFYGVYQPHLYNNKFIAFSHFSQIAEFLAIPVGAPISDLRIASEYVCSLSLEQLNIVFARVKDHYNRVHLCFHSAYIWVLLTYGFGFSPETRNIDFRQRFEGGIIDYVMGAMIYQLNQDPWLRKAGNASVLLEARGTWQQGEEVLITS